MCRSDFISEVRWKKVADFARTQETPFLVVLSDVVEEKYDTLHTSFPYADIYYAMKANPSPQLLRMLAEKGCCFDVASIYELERLLMLGVPAHRMSFGNTIKKARDIRRFHEAGVDLFVTDSESDIRTIAKEAPGSKVLVRLLVDGAAGADWPLSRKFGCSPDMAGDLLLLVRELGLVPYGLSFHVGSQQRDISAWDTALTQTYYLFRWLHDTAGIDLQCINMGGGFPADYVVGTNPLEVYAEEISRFLHETFGQVLPRIIIEPGRHLVGNSGVLVSEVILVSRKSRTAEERWVFQDCGKFGGLIETLGEAIRYPVVSEKEGEPSKVILAGPTCDSMDILYEENQYELPEDLESGDRLYWLSTGAYTSSYSSIEFNGFPPLRTFVI